MSNPNNYPGVEVTIVGWVAGPAKPPAYDKDGGKGVLEISIPVNQGYKSKETGEFVKTGTTWYSYTAAGEAAEGLRSLNKGDKVRIEDAKQEVREYTNKDGDTKLGIGLRYGTLTVLEAAGGEEF